MILHPIEPVFDGRSRILILGSFPSVRSRQELFFYGHPQNRFWKVLAAVFHAPEPCTTGEKRLFLLKNRIALWDVIASCEIEGSADSSIKNAQVNDLKLILQQANIQKIFVNGGTAKKYYDRYMQGAYQREALCLPSTSPANAAWSLERLIEAWQVIRI